MTAPRRRRAGLSSHSSVSMATTWRERNGGERGAVSSWAEGDVDVTGTNTFTGGDGGDGGGATAVNTTPGGNATAIGGHGGGVKPANGGSPVKIGSSGTITVSGTLH